MVNAVLNVAEQLSELARATNSLYYAFKYNKERGTSVAEAIENAGEKIKDAIDLIDRIG